ncbi:MAG: hypothetical protein JWO12_2507, partial [Frankiales bacterium]|nr:hypothetical protein [Frankiales bacterium]
MTLVLGVGASSRATSQEITALIVDTLVEQGFSTQDVTAVATLDSKRD